MVTQAGAATPPRTRPLWRRTAGPLTLLAMLALLTLLLRPVVGPFPEAWNLGLRQPIDALQDWVIGNRARSPLFVYGFTPLSAAIDAALRAAERLLLATPWPLLIGLAALAGWWLRGWRLALLCAGGLLLLGGFGLWKQGMETLALMAVSVLLALLIGLPLGMLAGISNRTERALRPLLDAMQTMPAFVYLVPVVLLFGIARVPAVIATLIYALPPVIRLTSLGIRQVPATIIEAARSFGTTKGQLLAKAQLPLALPAIMIGLNQTIMLALGMVVIAAMVGAGGLGREVLVSLQRRLVGQAFEAGLAIVVLAILLDRLSGALAERVASPAPHGWRWLAAAVLLTIAVLGINRLLPIGPFPASWSISIREPIDAAVAWMRDNLYQLGDLPIGTGPLSDFLTLALLKPLRLLLVSGLPWPIVILAVALLAQRVGGTKLALGSAAGLLLIGLLGMWAPAMDTLSQVLVTLLCTVLLAVPLGIAAAQSRRFGALLGPLLDFLQAVPTFVYLVPVIMLFNIGRVPGLIAAVLYAIPAGIRLTELGIRQVSPTTIEAARSFGTTKGQLLRGVQLPLAMPAIMAGVNQMLMLVLAMVVIAGLVGGEGLGLEAVTGLTRNQTGRGIEAGLAIVVLAMILDRLTQATTRGRTAGD